VDDDLGGRLIQDTGRSSPGDMMGRSIARVPLFPDRFWRSFKEQKDSVVRADLFGERMSSEDISWRAIRQSGPLSGE